jgi:hypothetical protein
LGVRGIPEAASGFSFRERQKVGGEQTLAFPAASPVIEGSYTETQRNDQQEKES